MALNWGSIGRALKTVPIIGSIFSDISSDTTPGHNWELEKWCKEQGGVLTNGKCLVSHKMDQSHMDTMRDSIASENDKMTRELADLAMKGELNQNTQESAVQRARDAQRNAVRTFYGQ